MAEILVLPPGGRYKLTIVHPEDGHQDRLGRFRIAFAGDEAIRRAPDGTEIDRLVIVSAEKLTRKQWELTDADGLVWRLNSGCGCGGG